MTTFADPAFPATAEERCALLTARERELLQLQVDGLSPKQIARRWVVSLRTVRTHELNLRYKLGVHSQLQAVVVALRFGVVQL